MKKVLLKAEDMSKVFLNHGSQNDVLCHINLQVFQGDFTIIMRPSGAGKSTLLYALSGMDAISEGRVLVCDQGEEPNLELHKLSEKEMAKRRAEQFGFVFQSTHLVSNLSLYENVVVAGFNGHKQSADEVRERANRLLQELHISQIRDHLPSQVSGGEAQRAAIARAIINLPELIFADEPTGALNKANTEEILDILSNLNAEGQTILMVTHDVRAAARGNRLLYLEDGRIVGELLLEQYQQNDARERENKINTWLSELKW